MQVYLYMGTHLPELRRCIESVVETAPQLELPALVHVPDGLGWTRGEGHPAVIEYDPGNVLWVLDPDRHQTCHILVDPRVPLIPQLEGLADNLQKCLIEPVKILTCVDCERAESHGKLRNWLDACIYYSDIVLLGNRSGASKPFVRDFQKQYERLCYPCLFMYLKADGMPANTGEILFPGTRRLSQMFEIEGPVIDTGPSDFIIESSCDLDMPEQEVDPFRSSHDDQPPRHVPDVSGFVIFPEEGAGQKNSSN